MGKGEKEYRTKSGRVLPEIEIERLADEAERGYELELLKQRKRGRPSLGSGPAEVVPVRLDPEMRRAVEARAKAEGMTISEIVRRAPRKFLDVA